MPDYSQLTYIISEFISCNWVYIKHLYAPMTNVGLFSTSWGSIEISNNCAHNIECFSRRGVNDLYEIFTLFCIRAGTIIPSERAVRRAFSVLGNAQKN